MDNYPITVFKNDLKKRTNCIHLNEGINFAENFWYTIMCHVRGLDYNAKKGYDKQTIDIDLKTIIAVNFNISLENKNKMFKYRL